MFNYIPPFFTTGVIILLFGILFMIDTIYFTKPNPNSPLVPFASGILSSICFILLGISMMYWRISHFLDALFY